MSTPSRTRKSRRVLRVWGVRHTGTDRLPAWDVPCLYGTRADAEDGRDVDEDVVECRVEVLRVVPRARAR